MSNLASLGKNAVQVEYHSVFFLARWDVWYVCTVLYSTPSFAACLTRACHYILRGKGGRRKDDGSRDRTRNEQKSLFISFLLPVLFFLLSFRLFLHLSLISRRGEGFRVKKEIFVEGLPGEI